MTIFRLPNDDETKQAKAYLKTQGVTLSQTQLHELTARLHGYSDLAAMRAAVVPDEEDMARVCMQYEVATQESSDAARALVERIGLAAALEQWENDRELAIRLGPCIVRSELESGYWNENQGWVFDKRSATGYSVDRKDGSALAPDAKLVDYATAVDFVND